MSLSAQERTAIFLDKDITPCHKIADKGGENGAMRRSRALFLLLAAFAFFAALPVRAAEEAPRVPAPLKLDLTPAPQEEPSPLPDPSVSYEREDRSPRFSLDAGPLSFDPTLGREAVQDSNMTSRAIPAGEPTTPFDIGGRATLKTGDQMDLSLGYTAGRTASEKETAPLADLARDGADQKKIDLNMKLRF